MRLSDAVGKMSSEPLAQTYRISGMKDGNRRHPPSLPLISNMYWTILNKSRSVCDNAGRVFEAVKENVRACPVT